MEGTGGGGASGTRRQSCTVRADAERSRRQQRREWTAAADDASRWPRGTLLRYGLPPEKVSHLLDSTDSFPGLIASIWRGSGSCLCSEVGLLNQDEKEIVYKSLDLGQQHSRHAIMMSAFGDLWCSIW